MIYLVTGGSGSGKSAYAEGLILQADARERIYVATMEVFGEEGRRRVERHRQMREGKGFRTIEWPRGLENLCLDKREESVCLEGQAEIRQLNEQAETRKLNEQAESWKLNEQVEMSRAVLVECLGNLAANELFGSGGSGEDEIFVKEGIPIKEEIVIKEGILIKEEIAIKEGGLIKEEILINDRFSIREKRKLAQKRIKAGIENLERQCSLLVIVGNEVFSDGIDYGEETNEYIRLMGELHCWLGERADKVIEVVYGIAVQIR